VIKITPSLFVFWLRRVRRRGTWTGFGWCWVCYSSKVKRHMSRSAKVKDTDTQGRLPLSATVYGLVQEG
jgi:hypothetical protein